MCTCSLKVSDVGDPANRENCNHAADSCKGPPSKIVSSQWHPKDAEKAEPPREGGFPADTLQAKALGQPLQGFRRD